MKALLFTFLCFYLNFSAYADGVEGGGGRSIVCRDPNGKITSAEVLDLFEGRVQYQLEYKSKPIDFKAQIKDLFMSSTLEAQERLWAFQLRNRIGIILDNMKFIPEGNRLLPVNDSHEIIVPKKCGAEQSVNYFNDRTILFDLEIWNALNETNKAALIMHEAIYKELRESALPEKNSKRARHYNAFLFAGNRSSEVYPKATETQILACSGVEDENVTEFFVHKSLSKNTAPTFYFTHFQGRRILTESKIDHFNIFDLDFKMSEIFDQLLKPNKKVHFYGSTQSDFEFGDTVSISVYEEKKSKEFKIKLHGKSSLDDRQFNIEIRCK